MDATTAKFKAQILRRRASLAATVSERAALNADADRLELEAGITSSLVGKRVRYVGADGQTHGGTVLGVRPWDGSPEVMPIGEPCATVQVGYSTTFGRASSFEVVS